MPAAVDQDRTACEGQAPSRMRLVTTLYDLIAALHESIEPGEEDLVTAAVVHLVNAGHVKCLSRLWSAETRRSYGVLPRLI